VVVVVVVVVVLLLPQILLLFLPVLLLPLFALPLSLQPSPLQNLLQRGRYRPRNRPELILAFAAAALAGAAVPPDRGSGQGFSPACSSSSRR
jgi:hypothetical protein